MIKELYISKSFNCLGDSLDKCFDCKYCRLMDEWDKNVNYTTIPTNINKNFSNLPIAINLFYGDPLLQIKNTVNFLSKLEKAEHKGPIVIITKGDFSLFPDIKFDLDLHFAFSTFGIEKTNYDGRTFNNFRKNLRVAHNRNNQYKYSIEFRPIVCDINDSDNSFYSVFLEAQKYNLPIGFSGLQGKPDVVEIWNENKYDFKPYPGYSFGHKKSLSDDRINKIYELSGKMNVNVFKKTSCLISFIHGLDRDYNAHYYRQSELSCDLCVMKDKCFSAKSKRDELMVSTDMIPFKHELIQKENHVCILKKNGICEFPTEDCSHISGGLIKINENITTADVRVIKWLTGYTVDANFFESPYLSENWRNND